MNERYYIAEILRQICTEVLPATFAADIDPKFASLVKSNIFSGHRPSAKHRASEFIVVRTSASLGEHNVYQQAAIYFDVYVRNRENGLESTVRLQKLIDRVATIFPYMSPDRRWSIKNPALVIKGDDGLEYTAWCLRASLQINTTDRFAIESH